MLRSIEEIPSKFRHIFEKFPNFNRMQSEVIDKILQTDKSIVVSAPTGSGKTVILELAIVRLLKKIDDTEYKDEFKIIYIAPIKALCNEITADWKLKFDRLGVLVGSVTGDDNDFDLNTSKFSIIVTTPEKFDSLSRKWNACDYMRAIKLLMIDEVHLLNEDKRGPILEAVVSRMKTVRLKLNQQNDSTDRIRFIAVSATIPNIADLAAWLDDKDNTIYHRVAEDLRPVKLERHVLGYPYYNSTPFRFDMNLTYKLPSIIEKYSNNKPALIFCNSRRSAEMGATTIVDKMRLNLSDEQRRQITDLSTKLEDVKLRKTVLCGVAFHHAGLCVSDKKLIEEYFRASSLLILFSTNTLAMGVNLPAYLSVIKSTEMLVSGSVHELSEAVILQMIGRAGRPQFDDHGVAIIMTQSSKVQKYENLISGTAPIESHLHNHLTEHLNSEIVSQTITNMDLVTVWVRSSYLYIRVMQKPLHYGFPADAAMDQVERKLEELCVTAIDELEKYGLVTKTKSSLKSTQLGRLMAHFYLNFETMKHFTKVTGSENVQEIFGILITCPDFTSGYHLRVKDKRFLNDLNAKSQENDGIRFPIHGKVKTVTDKISCLMQAVLSNIPVTESSISEEASQLVKLGQRIGRALQEYIAVLDVKNNFSALVSITLLLKSLHANLWENSPYGAKQFNKIGHVYSKVLASNGKTTFESILNSTPSDIEMILKKRPPFGKEFLNGVLILPQFTIDVDVNREQKQVSVVVKQVNPRFVCDRSSRGLTLIVGDATNETLFIDHRVQYFLVKYGKFERSVCLKNPTACTVTAHLIHNGIVGLDKTVVLNHDLQPVSDQIEASIEEPGPVQVPTPKRKLKEKAKPPAKQRKISEYLATPKKAQKRKNETKTKAKRAKSSQAECDEQIALLESDDIGAVDLTTEENLTNKSDANNDKSNDIQATKGNKIKKQSTINFIQSFKMPTKKVFRFVRPATKPSNDVSLHDMNMDVENAAGVTDEVVLHSTNTLPQASALPKNQMLLTTGAPTKPFAKTMVNVTAANEESSHSTNTKGDEAIARKTEAKKDTVNEYVPSCIKSMFGSQAVSQRVPISPVEINVPRKKDINFRYEHLLTPIPEVEISSSYSLCDVIEEQHKLQRMPVSQQTPAFPFHDFYIQNFSAAKELEKIDQIIRTNKDVIDDEGPLFSLEYDTVPSQTYSHRMLADPVCVDYQHLVLQQPSDKIVAPMALNEHKYSKNKRFSKKLLMPQPSSTCQPPNEVKWKTSTQKVNEAIIRPLGIQSAQNVNVAPTFRPSPFRNSLQDPFQSSQMPNEARFRPSPFRNSPKDSFQSTKKVNYEAVFRPSRFQNSLQDQLQSAQKTTFPSSQKPQLYNYLSESPAMARAQNIDRSMFADPVELV